MGSKPTIESVAMCIHNILLRLQQGSTLCFCSDTVPASTVTVRSGLPTGYQLCYQQQQQQLGHEHGCCKA
jgi:hypothetical protein